MVVNCTPEFCIAQFRDPEPEQRRGCRLAAQRNEPWPKRSDEDIAIAAANRNRILGSSLLIATQSVLLLLLLALRKMPEAKAPHNRLDRKSCANLSTVVIDILVPEMYPIGM